MFGIKKKLEIKSQGAIMVRLDELNKLHHFKRLTEKDLEKGRANLLDRGFKFPFAIWIDETGKKWTVDGHQRTDIITWMRDTKGDEVPEEFPASLVFSKDKHDAGLDIIASESQYGEFVEIEFTDFFNEFNIKEPEVEEWSAMPDMDFEKGEPEGDENADLLPKEPEELQCPNCHHIGKQAEFRKQKKDE